MIVRIGRRGSSFKGASTYHLHDKRQPGETERLTSERVAWAETLNLVNDDPQLAWREMWRTARDQKDLKQAAGERTGGSRVKEPVLPIVLSWAAPDQPTPEQQRAAAYQFLERMGWDKHQALILAHRDTDNQHVHIQRAALRNAKVHTRHERPGVEMTESRIAKRVQEMQREDEQRRERDRDGFGRERTRDRGGGGKER